MAKDVKDLERKHLSGVIQVSPYCSQMHPYMREAEGDETQGEMGVMQPQPRNANSHQMLEEASNSLPQNLWREYSPATP